MGDLDNVDHVDHTRREAERLTSDRGRAEPVPALVDLV
jgi:hypothetical protein